MGTHLEDGLDTIACDEAAVHTLLDRATHPDGSEMVEVEMADIPSRQGVLGSGDWEFHSYQ